MRVYLDNAATTKVHPKVVEKIQPYLNEAFGNPSSIHSFGRNAKVAIEDARETIADFINADASEIYFNSGGTEANNFSIFGIAQESFKDNGKKTIVTSTVEHNCVLEAFDKLENNGFTAKKIGVNPDSSIPTDFNIPLDDASLVSLIHTNNETGSINNISSIFNSIKAGETYFHTDAVQAFGKVPIDVNELGVHSLSASGHKIGALKGIGFTYVKARTPMESIITGGSQERNRRGGTENVIGIISLAEAVKVLRDSLDDNFEAVKKLRKRFVDGLNAIDSKYIIVNESENQSPYLLNITFNSHCYRNDAESMLMFLDLNGVAASNGAACTSGTLKPSHVILAMGIPEDDANGTIRFSFSPDNTPEEIDYTLEILTRMSKKFKR